MGKAAYSCRRRREREVDSSHRSASLITNAQSEARPGPSEADYSIALRIFEASCPGNRRTIHKRSRIRGTGESGRYTT
jgi:hypothetical protein